MLHGQYHNIKWSFSDGILTISGKGPMPDWDTSHGWQPALSPAITPWYEAGIRLKIEQVIIEEGITTVGIQAFDRCMNLKKVMLADTVRVICASAFLRCKSLSEIHISNSVTHIRECAFCGCEVLKEITLPDKLAVLEDAFPQTGIIKVNITNGVRRIMSDTFYGCEQLKEIIIPSSVKEINDGFCECPNLERVSVSSKNKHFVMVDGVLFDKDMTRLLLYPACKPERDYIIPSTVTEIDECAFHNCRNLTSVFIPENTRFKDNSVFFGCEVLENITVSDQNKIYKSVNGVLFSKDGKTLIQYPQGRNGAYKIPDSVETISHEAFYKCNGLTELYIQKNINEIHCFYCTSLHKIDVAPENTSFVSVDGVLYSKDMSTLLIYPSGKTEEHFDMPDSVTTVDAAFDEDCKLKSIHIGKSFDIHTPHNSLCRLCQLENIDVAEDNKYYTSHNGIMYSKNMDMLVVYPSGRKDSHYDIPETVTSCAIGVFNRAKYIKSFETSNNRNFVFKNGTLWNTTIPFVHWDKDDDMAQDWRLWNIEQGK